MIASQALLTLGVPLARVLRRVQAQRAGHYQAAARAVPRRRHARVRRPTTPTPTACTRCACPQDSRYRGRPLSDAAA